jgi:hypothetical protein
MAVFAAIPAPKTMETLLKFCAAINTLCVLDSDVLVFKPHILLITKKTCVLLSGGRNSFKKIILPKGFPYLVNYIYMQTKEVGFI